MYLHKQRFLLLPESSFSGLVNLVKGIFRNFQHFHVRTKLFNQRLDDVFSRRYRRDADTFRRDFLTAAPVLRLVVEPHHTVKLKILKKIEF